MIDYDKSVFDVSVFDDETDCYPSSGYGFGDFLDGTVVSGSLVYALRNFERSGITYRFYTRDTSHDYTSYLCRAAEIKIFRYMPSCKRFGGFISDIPESCDVLVTSDMSLFEKAGDGVRVIYIGNDLPMDYRDKNIIQIDCFSQLPMLIDDIRCAVAC